MNYSIRHKIALLTACAALPAAGLLAQAPAAPASTPSVSVPAATSEATPAEGKHHGEKKGWMADLTPEEKQKLKAAHQKAMQDPAVKSAEATKETDKKGFHKAVREAMLRADPSIQPILEKMREEHKGKKDA